MDRALEASLHLQRVEGARRARTPGIGSSSCKKKALKTHYTQALALKEPGLAIQYATFCRGAAGVNK